MKLSGLKYLLFLLPLFVGAYKSLGQRKGFDNLTYFDDRKLHFGFYLGLNTMDYRLKNYKDVADNPVFKDNPQLLANTIERYGGKSSLAAEIYTIMPGFTVGGVVNARLGRDIDLRFTPGMSLGNRHFKLLGIENPIVDPGIDLKTYLYIPSAYLDLPVGIRYKGFRHHNLRPYIYTGAAFRQDLESQKRISEGVVHLKKSGPYAEVALGLDSYLEYFRFTAEFRFSYGLNNLIRHDITNPLPYYGYIFKELNSNLFTLIFYFE